MKILTEWFLKIAVDVSKSLLLSNQQLASVDLLKEQGIPQQFSVGQQVCRGFADIGYEQFLLLPAGKLLSLFTGDCSTLDEEQQDFFAVIPSVEDMAAYAADRGMPVAVEFSDYTWFVKSETGSSGTQFENAFLWQALVDYCLSLQEAK